MVSVKEKIAYGLGDTASNIIFQTVMMFLMLYYTDVVGLSPAVVGTMFLAVRIFDAVTDPLMGNLADKTHTRWGHFRPYLLWLALPFAIISILAFTTPDLEGTDKIIYAFTTYTLLMVALHRYQYPLLCTGRRTYCRRKRARDYSVLPVCIWYVRRRNSSGLYYANG